MKPRRVRAGSPYQWHKVWVLVGLYFLVGLFLVWTLFPIYWILLTSLKTIQQVNTMPPLFFFKPTLETYAQLLTGDAMLAFRNSLIVSLSTVLIALVVGFPAAYTLACHATLSLATACRASPRAAAPYRLVRHRPCFPPPSKEAHSLRARRQGCRERCSGSGERRARPTHRCEIPDSDRARSLPSLAVRCEAGSHTVS